MFECPLSECPLLLPTVVFKIILFVVLTEEELVFLETEFWIFWIIHRKKLLKETIS